MILKVLSNTWKIDLGTDIQVVQNRGWADTRDLQENRGQNGACCKDDFFVTSDVSSDKLTRCCYLFHTVSLGPYVKLNNPSDLPPRPKRVVGIQMVEYEFLEWSTYPQSRFE